MRHQCAVFGSYWVRCSLLGPRMHQQIATALHQCSVSAPDPLFLSVSASHSLPGPRSRSSISSGSMAPSHLAWSTSCGGGGASPSPPLQHQTSPRWRSGGGAAHAQLHQWMSSARGPAMVEQCARRPIPQRRRSSRNSIAVLAASPSSLSLVVVSLVVCVCIRSDFVIAC